MWSDEVNAFMKFDNDRGSILKNGSRTGYLKGCQSMFLTFFPARLWRRVKSLLQYALSTALGQQPSISLVQTPRTNSDKLSAPKTPKWRFNMEIQIGSLAIYSPSVCFITNAYDIQRTSPVPIMLLTFRFHIVLCAPECEERLSHRED